MSKKLKIILSISIFLLIVLAVSRVSFGEQIDFGGLSSTIQAGILRLLGLGSDQPSESVQTYELLLKKTATGSGEGAYQAGDIVIIELEGYQWASGEIANFYIVKMNLTAKQAEELVRAKEIETGEKDENGQTIIKMEARRLYKYDIKNKIIISK